MRLINQESEILHPEEYDNIQKHIERIGRTCYKSEDRITNDSHRKFIKMLNSKKHWAMLEHYIFIYEVSKEVYDILCSLEYNLYNDYGACTSEKIDTTYIRKTSHFDSVKNKKVHMISFSARSLLDIKELLKNGTRRKSFTFINNLIYTVINDYDCDELFGLEEKLYYSILDSTSFHKVDNIFEYDMLNILTHGWFSVKFTCDRGVSHEIVRHRTASFAQESTRYCSYDKDKFGNGITVIPVYETTSSDNPVIDIWYDAMKSAEKAYFKLLELGESPQMARSVLPNSLKTELVMTSRIDGWVHFFELRCDKAAHPQIRKLACDTRNMLYDWICENHPKSQFNFDILDNELIDKGE